MKIPHFLGFFMKKKNPNTTPFVLNLGLKNISYRICKTRKKDPMFFYHCESVITSRIAINTRWKVKSEKGKKENNFKFEIVKAIK